MVLIPKSCCPLTLRRTEAWTMRKSYSIVGVLITTTLAPTLLRATSITYSVNETLTGGSMSGTIRTDGTIGTLVIANTVHWNLLIADGNLTLQLNPTNSTVQGLGSELSASTTSLMFNYSSGVAVCCDFYGFDPN